MVTQPLSILIMIPLNGINSTFPALPRRPKDVVNPAQIRLPPLEPRGCIVVSKGSRARSPEIVHSSCDGFVRSAFDARIQITEEKDGTTRAW
jgi:hypothetical protein